MSVDKDCRSLIEHIEKGMVALGKLEAFYDERVRDGVFDRRSVPDAIVVADIFTKYYTCLETIWLRISQFFENSLSQKHWHKDLLEKMTLRIEDLREPAVSDAAFPPLLELMRFRHFRRYYFEMDYDWDRLDFLRKKFEQARPIVRNDMCNFKDFVKSLI